MYAVIRAAGKQFRVEPHQEVRLPRLDVEPKTAFETTEVLLVGGDDTVKVGTPFVEGAKVVGTVVAHGKGKKIHGFKYKAKKNYRRRWGAREHFTTVRIEQISM